MIESTQNLSRSLPATKVCSIEQQSMARVASSCWAFSGVLSRSGGGCPILPTYKTYTDTYTWPSLFLRLGLFRECLPPHRDHSVPVEWLLQESVGDFLPWLCCRPRSANVLAGHSLLTVELNRPSYTISMTTTGRVSESGTTEKL